MPSFGEQLKRERKLRKVSLEEIAKATKISVRYLRALEANEFSQLPGGVFDRGFVRAYAQFVGLDEEATVEAYVAERGPEEVEQRDDGLDALRNPVETQPDDKAPSGSGMKGARALRLVALVIVVGVVSVAAWAVSRYFQAPEPGSAPPKQVAPATAQTAEQAPLENPPQPLTANASNQVDETEDESPAPITPAVEDDRVAEPEPEVVTRIEPPAAPAPTDTPTVESPRVAEQSTDPPPAAPAQNDERNSAVLIDARILVDRAAAGRVNCDNRRIEMLDGLRPGTVLELQCQRFLLLNVRDGGAVRVGLNGETPLRLAADGEPLNNYGIYP